MKKIILIAFVSASIQASQFEELKKQSLLGLLPAELMNEIKNFSEQRLLQEIASANSYNAGLQKVRELSENPVNAKFFEDTKFLEAVFLALGSYQYSRPFPDQIANDLNIPASQQWVIHTLPQESGLEEHISKPDLEAVKTDLEGGVNIEARVGKHSATPLLTAIQEAFDYSYILKKEIVPVINYLLEKRANVNAVDAKGNSPLFIATENDNKTLVQLLIEHGANPFIQNKYGQMPISYAKERNLKDIFDILKRGEKNGTAEQRLFFATVNNDLPEVKNLIEKLKAHVNARDGKGLTPLMRTQNFSIASYLLEHGADVNARDSNGNTVLMRSLKEWPNAELIGLYLQYKADPSIKNTDGRSALDIITGYGTLTSEEEQMLHHLRSAIASREKMQRAE